MCVLGGGGLKARIGLLFFVPTLIFDSELEDDISNSAELNETASKNTSILLSSGLYSVCRLRLGP